MSRTKMTRCMFLEQIKVQCPRLLQIMNIHKTQGDFFHWYGTSGTPHKSSKYKKVDLGEVRCI